MHIHFERIEKPHSFSDCNILSLSWMGKVPDGSFQSSEEEGWKLNRTNYYQDGWIALGNVKGIVGVTYTTCKCRNTSSSDLPQRTNYNLRGHRSKVTLVKWNEPYQKLVSCDNSGIIIFWIKYEGRWSVELINDRGTRVTDLCWSHDGRMVLILYIDGFVSIGSVAGQRYWSSMLNLDACSTTTCSIWAPDDVQVIFGTSNGFLLVIDINGTIIAQVSVREGCQISSMAWSMEKFKMEDSEEEDLTKSCVLAICFHDGIIYLLKNYDDIFPIIIRTNLESIKMEWSNKDEILAVGGHKTKKSIYTSAFINVIQFYTSNGVLRYTISLDYTLHPLSALTWGHNDRRLFVGIGPVLHIAWVTKRIASLQLLCRLAVYRRIPNEKLISSLPLPSLLQTFISSLFGRTLRCYLPDINNLIKFVVYPPKANTRLYCTLIRHDDKLVGGASSYVLYLEYLGGLVPILKGKRTSKFRPEFVIFDPSTKESIEHHEEFDLFINQRSLSSPLYWSSSACTSESETDEKVTPQVKKRRLRKIKRHEEFRLIEKKENFYTDEMPEDEKLILVTSNIWGTKFKMLGLVSWLPTNLGSVAYRTSLLHLQPRQMTLKIKELGGRRKTSFASESQKSLNDKSLAISSEDEEDIIHGHDDYSIPIAPMTPKKNIRYQGQSCTVSPERRASYYFRTSNFSHASEYFNLIPHINDELLTLQINGDGLGYMTMEMSAPPQPSHHINHITSNTISTQTSFQSVNDIISGCDKLCSNTPPPEEDKDNISLYSTEDTFNMMAKRFASEPATIRTPASQSLVFNRYELFQTSRSNVQMIFSPLPSPTLSPTKSLRNKRVRRDQRKSLFETDKSCDNYSPSCVKTHRGLSSSTWNGSISFVSRQSDATLLESKQVNSTVHDIKFIDDEVEEETFTRSPSLVIYKNRPIAQFHSIGSPEITSIRTDCCHSQRRYTLSKPVNDGIDAEEKKVGTNNCMSLDEENQGSDLFKFCSKCKETSERKKSKSSNITESALFSNEISSPVHLPKRKYLKFGSNELLNSFNNSYSTHHYGEEISFRSNRANSIDNNTSIAKNINELRNRSLPASPIVGKKNKPKSIFYSPTMFRKIIKQKLNYLDCSSEDDNTSDDEFQINDLKDRESFQKAYLRKKLVKKRRGSRITPDENINLLKSNGREFLLHNKAPLWNEASQVYQLDFGGRVTQESAKNFQIEHQGKQVMQFGRIDENAYTLDFQYPFSALQALAVGLANLTQRLK